MKEKTRKKNQKKVAVGIWITREYAKQKYGFDLYYELLIKGATDSYINKITETINISMVQNVETYRRKKRG